jgi:hypothetical protein
MASQPALSTDGVRTANRGLGRARERRRGRTWARRDALAAAVLFLGTAGTILWQNAHIVVLWDASYVLDSAVRMAQGQIPYRDFPFAHAPLTFLMQAAIIRLFGRVFFHHVLYAALAGAAGTVLAWRIALDTLRGRVRAAWAIALLLAAPLMVLGIYCIVPLPNYDCDCALAVLAAIWLLRRVADTPASAWRGFAAGVAACVPLFFKQNIGLPFLVAVVGAVMWVLAMRMLPRGERDAAKRERAPLIALLAGAVAALVAAALVIHATAGLGNYLHWTIQFAAERRMPGAGAMLGVYRDPNLLWTLPCVGLGLLLLQLGIRKKSRPAVGCINGPDHLQTIPQGLKPGFQGAAFGTTEVVPFYKTSSATNGGSEVENVARIHAANDDLLAEISRVGHPGSCFPTHSAEGAEWMGHPVWARIAAFALLAMPFLFALSSLLRFDDADERGDSLLALWPLLLTLALVLALGRLVKLGRTVDLRALTLILLLAAIHGAFLSQQLWGSTYGIWPLLVLLLAEMLAFVAELPAKIARGEDEAPCTGNSPRSESFPQGLEPEKLCDSYGTAEAVPFQDLVDASTPGHERGGQSGRWFAPALAALVSITLLVCGGFYNVSEERLSYIHFPEGAQFPDGPVMHSALPAVKGTFWGMSTPGEYLPEFDELLRYAASNIPENEGLILIPGEDPFYFATGRTPRFPVLLFDPATDPYSPAQVAELARQRNIQWLIVKRDLQIKEDPTPERAATIRLLMQEFTPAAHLRGYDVYRRARNAAMVYSSP